MSKNTGLVRRLGAAFGAAALALGIAAPAVAETVNVQIRGTVEYNGIGGDLAGKGAGTPVLMSFLVDSGDFINSADWPTRGYRIDLSSFVMNIGGVAVTLESPQPDGAEALFVLRDNDPAVDGFFLSSGPDYRWPLAVNIPGLAPLHELEFGRTFDSTTVLHSLDILDAVGEYGWERMSSYQFTLGRFGNYGFEAMYESISISAVPEPGAVLLFACGGGVLLLLAGRKRRLKAGA